MEKSPGQPKVYKETNLHIVFGVTIIAIMGVSSLTPAFPGISDHFDISPQEVGLLITFFTLPGVLLTPVFGVLADHHGRKRILIPLLLLFAVAGTACFFVRDFTLLLVLRFLQGIGAAPLGSLNVTIIGDNYEGRERSAAMGYNASVLSIGTASFPVIGGILASIAWFYPFLLPVIGFGVALFAYLKLDTPEPKNEQTLKEYIKSTFAVMKQGSIIGIFGISVLTFIILYGPYLTYMPFIIGETFAQPAYIIGIIMASSSIATAITSTQMGRLTDWLTSRKMILISGFFYFVSMALIPFMPGAWLLIIPAVVFGIAQGINIPSLLNLLTSLTPMEQRAAVMSVNGTIFRIGQTLGPLAVAPAYAIMGLKGVFLLGAVSSVILIILAVIFLIGKKY